MARDLSRLKERDALRCRREPYWQRLRPGCFLGYRPSTRGDVGTWIARAYDEDHRCYRLKSLGSFASIPGRERFTEAKTEAEAFGVMVETGGYLLNRPETVEEACEQYAESRPDAAKRFVRFVYPDPIAKIRLSRLRRHHLVAWRQRITDTPALVSRGKRGPRVTRPRAPATVNRDMAVIRAALNKVMAPGIPGTEAAWQEALRAVPNASRQRTLYLDRNERRALLEHMDAEAEPFIRTLCLLPLRPGAVAQLTVRDFDERTAELSIIKDKNGKPRRILVPEPVVELMATQVPGKALDAPLFTRANGKPWDRNTWNDPIARAAACANLRVSPTAYTFRHSTITDLINGGLPLLTVAQISDTSAEMIERHYGHLCRRAAVEALAGLAL